MDDTEDEQQPMNFTDRITADNIGDLFELCKSKCPVKYLSVLIYATLRSFGHSWKNCDTFLRTIGELLNYHISFLSWNHKIFLSVNRRIQGTSCTPMGRPVSQGGVGGVSGREQRWQTYRRVLRLLPRLGGCCQRVHSWPMLRKSCRFHSH